MKVESDMPSEAACPQSIRQAAVPDRYFSRRFLTRLRKPICWLASALPLAYLALLVFQAANGSIAALGADPGKAIVLYLGEWALIMLLVTLSVSPLQELLKVKLVPLRRMLGLFAFTYAVLHLGAYLVLLLELQFGELWSEILERPYITVGALAVFLMTPLAITSTKGMQRRLGRNWKRLHQLIYPIAFLAIIHFFWQTRSDFTEPLLYSAALALVMGQRVLKSRRKWSARQAR